MRFKALVTIPVVLLKKPSMGRVLNVLLYVFSYVIIYFIEALATVAFAVSGAVVGIEKKMDIFGVVILGLTTSVGGGIMRDLILNIAPPAAFRDPVFALTAIVVSIIVFIPAVRLSLFRNRKVFNVMILILDSIGLGLFTVIGVQVAQTTISEENYFLAVFVGVLTGVGGGLMRDVFAGNRPYIFIKHFYACASIVGAITCILLWRYVGESISMITGASVTLILRLLAAKFRWSLPKAK